MKFRADGFGAEFLFLCNIIYGERPAGLVRRVKVCKKTYGTARNINV